MKEHKVLMIDTVHPAFNELVKKSGLVCIDGTSLSREEILNVIDQYEGVVIRSRFRLDAEFFFKATNLKFVARSGAGMENIEVTAASEHKVQLINAPEGNRDAVAEHAIAMLLSLFNRIITSDREVRSGIWKREENRGVELNGKTVGIIGFGNMGSAFAQRLSGFGVRILAYDPYIKIDEKLDVKQVEMQEIFDNADVVSLHVPLTKETEYLVNGDWLSNFKKSLYIINTSRGKVLSNHSLKDALVTGKVKGACLDVSEYESTSFEQLDWESFPDDWKYITASDRVILSPHVAGWSFESYQKLSEVMADKVNRLYI